MSFLKKVANYLCNTILSPNLQTIYDEMENVYNLVYLYFLSKIQWFAQKVKQSYGYSLVVIKKAKFSFFQ